MIPQNSDDDSEAGFSYQSDDILDERNLNQCGPSINDYQSDSSDDILDERGLNKCETSTIDY